MLSWIREKFGTVVIGGIIGFIAFVFVFYGVFSPKSTRGLHEGAVAGTVNGDAVTLEEFNREFKRRVEFFRNLSGGKFSDEQIQSFHLREMVFDELARRKLLIQQVDKLGIDIADERVRDAIREIPAFQSNGKFDILKYKQLLEANQYSAGGFEKMVRDDLATQQWDSYFARRAWVSEEELRDEFRVSEEKRKIKYVLLTQEAGRKQLQVDPAEVQKYLAEASKLNLVKAQYESRKETAYKGKSFDSVKDAIAKDLIAGARTEEIQKANQKLAEQIKTVLTAKADSDGKVNAILKPVGLEVKATDWLTRRSSFIPAIGEAGALLKDVFSKAGVNANANQQAKIYTLASGTLVAVVTGSQTADSSKFDAQREQLTRQLTARKQRELYQGWVNDLMKKAKIDRNPAVFAPEEEQG